MYMAVAKQTNTMAAQAALAVRDLAVEMCAKPWIVELSKKSQKEAVIIFSIFLIQQSSNIHVYT